MRKRRILSLLLVLVLCFAAVPLTARAAGKTGWEKKGGIWYYYEDDQLVTGWKKIGGKWYFFDITTGEMAAGGMYGIDGKDYYFNADGVMQTGWVKQNYDWFYFGSSGAAVQGFQKIGSHIYYFNPGIIKQMVTGTITIDGEDYTFSSNGYLLSPSRIYCNDAYYAVDANGKIKTGWVIDNDIWYYYGSDGKGATGWEKISGKWYYFGVTGVMYADAWIQEDGDWYYFDPSGAMKTGWVEITGVWYYQLSSGKSAMGWCKVDGKWYYFDPDDDGAMVTGWKEIKGEWYYFFSSGAMATGWQKIDDYWFYFETSGKQVIGWKQIGGKWYYFNPNNGGTMTVSWAEIDGYWYNFDSSGAMRSNCWIIDGGGKSWLLSSGRGARGWQQIGGKWYYFNPNHNDYMATGYVYIGDDQYYFGDDGVMRTGWVKGSYMDGTVFWTYQLSSGKSAQGWQQIGGKWYYFKGKSVDYMMAQDETLYIEGYYYTFDASGVWIH